MRDISRSLCYTWHTPHKELIRMTEREKFGLKNAAASSAMEGLPLSEEQMHTAELILDGKMTLEDYFSSLQAAQQNS